MRILADENIPREVVAALRTRGHDVSWMRREAPGCGDRDLLARVAAEERVVVTFDKEFGELAFAARLPPSAGIVLVRLASPSPSSAAETLVRTLESRDDWAGRFSVVEEDCVRMIPLPVVAGRA